MATIRFGIIAFFSGSFLHLLNVGVWETLPHIRHYAAKCMSLAECVEQISFSYVAADLKRSDFSQSTLSYLA